MSTIIAPDETTQQKPVITDPNTKEVTFRKVDQGPIENSLEVINAPEVEAEAYIPIVDQLMVTLCAHTYTPDENLDNIARFHHTIQPVTAFTKKQYDPKTFTFGFKNHMNVRCGDPDCNAVKHEFRGILQLSGSTYGFPVPDNTCLMKTYTVVHDHYDSDLFGFRFAAEEWNLMQELTKAGFTNPTIYDGGDPFGLGSAGFDSKRPLINGQFFTLRSEDNSLLMVHFGLTRDTREVKLFLFTQEHNTALVSATDAAVANYNHHCDLIAKTGNEDGVIATEFIDFVGATTRVGDLVGFFQNNELKVGKVLYGKTNGEVTIGVSDGRNTTYTRPATQFFKLSPEQGAAAIKNELFTW